MIVVVEILWGGGRKGIIFSLVNFLVKVILEVGSSFDILVVIVIVVFLDFLYY